MSKGKRFEVPVLSPYPEGKSVVDETELLMHPEKWKIIGATEKSPSFYKLGKQNQDAMAFRLAESTDGTAVAAVADGHGSKPHFRSKIGAEMAVQLAISMLPIFLRDNKGIDEKALESKLRNEFFDDFSWSWFSYLQNHLKQNPPDETEKLALGGVSEIALYGTTILMAASTDKFDIFIKLGDGGMASVAPDGKNELIFPIEWREDQGTASLCMEGPEAFLEVKVMPRTLLKNQLLLLFTDGVSGAYIDSMPQDWQELRQKITLIWKRLREKNGLKNFQTFLKLWMQNVAEISRDDCTVVAMWRGKVRRELIDALTVE